LNKKSKILEGLVEIKGMFNEKALFPTLIPEAFDLIRDNPFAFSVAICLDRGTKVEIIWTIPFWIHEQVGHFNPQKFYPLAINEITEIFKTLPKKPRYTNAAPRTFQDITKIVVEEYDGNASDIWINKTAQQVKRVFLSVYGVGNGIANMAVLLIEEAYGITFSDIDHSQMDIKPDVHTMRVLYRLGISTSIDENEAIEAARVLSPSYPGYIDGPLWSLGRYWCHATNPNCIECPMKEHCPKIDL
jgi:endonuclease III